MSDYIDLIERVREIDESAATYMENDAKSLEDFVEDGLLVECFYWEDTPQGDMFWRSIRRELGEDA